MKKKIACVCETQRELRRVKMELSHRLNSANPSIKQILDNFTECLRIMQRNDVYIGPVKTKPTLKDNFSKRYSPDTYRKSDRLVRSNSDPEVNKIIRNNNSHS